MPNPERNLLRILCLPFLLEASQYAALAPLLPHYVEALHVSHTAAGVLMSSYAAGVLLGAVIGGGALAARVGLRATVLLGLLLLAIANAAFAIAHGIVALDAIRFAQGVAGGCIWAGGLSWLIGSAGPGRRGQGLGMVLSVAMLGTIIGPLIGTAALALGIGGTFVGLAGAALISLVFVARAAAPAAPTQEEPRPTRRALRSPLIVGGVWLLLVEAGAIGALYVLVPLRLDELGASGATIGVTFTLASLLAVLTTRVTGRASDEHGPWPLAAVALLASILTLGAMSLAGSALALATFVVVGIGAALVPIGVPACMLVIRGAEQEGISIAMTSIMLTTCFAAGEVVGGPLAAWLSGVTSPSVPYIVVALLELATLTVLLAAARGAAPSHGAAARGAVPSYGTGDGHLGPRHIDPPA